MKYVSVNKHRIRFVEKGKGFPLILIHGLGASIEWWQHNIDFLSQKYRVIAFDFPGFGYSSKILNEYSLSYASKLIISFLDALGIRKASLIGNSMGGLISLSTALQYPQRIEKLILVDNAGFGRKLSFLLRLGSLFPVGELVLALRNQHTVKILLTQLFYNSKKLPSNLTHSILKIFDLPHRGEVFLHALRSGINVWGLKEEILSPIVEKTNLLSPPALIVWGAQDRIIPVSQAYRGNKLINHSRLYIFEKCGHMPQVEHAEEFNHLVLDFLET